MKTAHSALFALLAAPAVVRGSEAKFNYNPDSPYGPAFWGDLKIDNNQCNGDKNSPIAVETSSCDVKADYTLKSGNCTVADMTFTIDDHVVKAAYSGNCTKSTMQIPGVDGTYEALQFHIHTSSEHTIDGAFFGAELHVVHKQTDADRYAVYGMMIEATNDKNHEVFEAFLDGWTSIADDTVEACTTSVDSGGTTNANTSFTLTNDNSTAITQQARIGSQRKLSEDVFNVYDMVPKGSSFYHYDGGLTTPPCSEVVWWNLADTPVSISVLQYTRLTQLVLEYRNTETCELATVASPSGSTSRPTQALNGRIVKRICPTAFVEEVKTGSDTSTASVVSIVSALATAGAAAFALQVF